ncbi:nucleoside phosphorylase [Desulfococcaceae bacterium HSG8]|nr:nucleoside phosphorylase [Desulfococcaceae bacterium HSG8]
MTINDAIINPVKGKNAPNLGPVSVMVSSETDLNAICKLTNLGEDYFKNLMMSRVYLGYDSTANFSLAGPVVGAPYGVLLLETLIAWGAQKIIYYGWCGAISPDVRVGDIIIPTGAVIDEGTSTHYNADKNEPVRPSPDMLEATKEVLKKNSLAFHEGMIWTTDAIYRETREKVRYFQSKKVLAVEMEMSALFTVGKFRNMEISGILVVSDELSTLEWRPGFKEERFKQSRAALKEVINELCQIL